MADDEKDMATCGACQAEVPADSESCPHCGVSFSGIVEDNLGECGACSALVPLDSKTCPQCGVLFVHDDVVAVLSDWMATTGLDVETLFGRLDTDGNGHIDTEELRAGLIALKIAALPPVEVDRLIAEIDQDNNGEIELGELQFILSSGSMQYADSVLDRVMKKHDISDADAFLQFARSFDENENRYLDQKELNKAAEAFVDKPEPEVSDEAEEEEEPEAEEEEEPEAEEEEEPEAEEEEEPEAEEEEEPEAEESDEEESEDSDSDEEMESAIASMISESTDEEAVEETVDISDDEGESDDEPDDDSDESEEDESSGKGRSFDPSSLIDDDDDEDDEEETSTDDMDDLIDSIDDSDDDDDTSDEDSEEDEIAPLDQETADGIMLEIGRTLNESNTTIDALFDGFDVDESGELDHYEFAKGLKTLDLADLPPHEVDRIVKFLDKDNNGRIDLNELRSNFNEWNVPISDLKPKRFEPAGWQKFLMKQYENVFPIMYVFFALLIAGLLVNAFVAPVDGSGGNIAFDGEIGEFSVDNNFYVEPGEIYPCDKSIQVTNCANSFTPLAGENGSNSMPKKTGGNPFYWDGLVGMIFSIGLLLGSVYLQFQTKGWRETVRAERKADSQDSEDEEDSSGEDSEDDADEVDSEDDTDEVDSEDITEDDSGDSEEDAEDAEEEDSEESDDEKEADDDGIDVGDRVGVELEDGEEAFGEILEFIEEDDEEFVVVLLDDGDEVEVEFDMIFLEE